jgi:hypothetical protein
MGIERLVYIPTLCGKGEFAFDRWFYKCFEDEINAPVKWPGEIRDDAKMHIAGTLNQKSLS